MVMRDPSKQSVWERALMAYCKPIGLVVVSMRVRGRTTERITKVPASLWSLARTHFRWHRKLSVEEMTKQIEALHMAQLLRYGKL